MTNLWGTIVSMAHRKHEEILSVTLYLQNPANVCCWCCCCNCCGFEGYGSSMGKVYELGGGRGFYHAPAGSFIYFSFYLLPLEKAHHFDKKLIIQAHHSSSRTDVWNYLWVAPLCEYPFPHCQGKFVPFDNYSPHLMLKLPCTRLCQ